MPPMAFTGFVTKVGCMNKTATVSVYRNVIHKFSGKRIERTTKILAHDEGNVLRLNDKVVIRNCPPISARKRFRLEKVLYSPETERELAHAKSETPATLESQTANSGGEVYSHWSVGSSLYAPPLISDSRTLDIWLVRGIQPDAQIQHILGRLGLPNTLL